MFFMKFILGVPPIATKIPSMFSVILFFSFTADTTLLDEIISVISFGFNISILMVLFTFATSCSFAFILFLIIIYIFLHILDRYRASVKAVSPPPTTATVLFL